MRYQVKHGDSPSIIARKYGVSMGALIGANPSKSTTTVAGVHTWRALRSGETVRVPVGVGDGFLGAIAPAPMNASHKQISITNPGPHVADADVALWQTILGVTADGLFGPNTQSATKAWQSRHGLSADGIVGPKSWAAAGATAGASAPAPAPVFAPSPAPMPAAAPTVTPVSAPLPVQALVSVDPCYSGNVDMVCAAQKALGITSDGKYGNDTASAMRRFVPSAPSGCSPRPSWWAPTGKSNCAGAASAPAPAASSMPSLPAPSINVPSAASAPAISSAPAAVQTLLSINPCDPSNAALVCAAQAALGVARDGKYGNDTAAAARRLAPNAPPGCSPRPSWWAPTGKSNCGGASPAAMPSLPSMPSTPVTSIPIPGVTPPQSAAPAAAPTPTSTLPVPAGSMQPAVSPSPATEKKGLSTGAMVAGALGAAAIVGVIAVAATGKKKGHGGGRSTSRRHGARKSARKSGHKKSSRRRR